MFVFSTYLPVFLVKIWAGELVGCKIKFHIQRVPTLHTFDGPRYPKNNKYLKILIMTSSSCFSGISYFWGSGVPLKYVVWVLIGCGIKFRIQQTLLLEIWVRTQGDMSKIRTKKSFFMIPIPKFILKNCLRPIGISNLKQFHWLTHDDMEFE